MEKRLYRSGYYTDKNTTHRQDKSQVRVSTSRERNIAGLGQQEATPEALICSSDDTFLAISQTTDTSDFQLCDTLFLRDSSLLSVRILEVSATEIKYSLCMDGETAVSIISKRKLLHIKYADGAEEYFMIVSPESLPQKSQFHKINENEKDATTDDYVQGENAESQDKSEPKFFMLTAFGLGTTGLGLLLGLLNPFFGFVICSGGAIMGLISLSKIKKNPELYRGKGLARAAVISGFVAAGLNLLIFMALIASMAA